jgi:hypothetical protein
MCRLAAALLISWVALFMPTASNANELTRQTISRNAIANRLNHEQLSSTPSAKYASSDATTEPVGILFLRSDGGDPKELRADADANLILIVLRNGEGRVYQNGRQIDINPVVKESANQIAMAQFGALAAGAQVRRSELSSAAQLALSRFVGTGIQPHIMFVHTASREDTARVSDRRAANIVAMEVSRPTAHLNDTVELVRMAMRMFALKSDACDNSPDPRCNRPGVRDAFAQIKREEALQHASASRSR